jgi:Host cell surface-exposed lipoprotein
MNEQYAHLTGEPSKPATPPTPGPVWSAPEPPRKKKHTFRKVVLWTAASGVVLLTGVGIIGAATGSGSTGSTPAASSTSNIPDSGTTEAPPKTEPTSNPFGDGDPTNDPNYQPPSSDNNWGVSEAPAAPTVAQQNALESAQGYLDMGDGMSKAGLIDQLHSRYGEGFSKADAIWAANHVHANWKHEAVLSAKGYLDMDGFSRAGLIDQLSSPYGEQFTLAQATYAADQVGL